MKAQSKNHSEQVQYLESLIPEYANHLNQIRFFYTQLESFSEIFDHNENPSYIPSLTGLKKQLDFNGFLTICYLDLLVTSKNLLNSKEYWEEVYYLRHGYLTIYEALNTYTEHSRWIRQMTTNKYDSLKPQFKHLSSSIRNFKKNFSYETTIAPIRNETTAHIDFNFLNYFEKISAFDIDIATESLISFLQVLAEMQRLSKAIVDKSGSILQKGATQFDHYLQNLMREIAEKFDKLNKPFSK